MIIQFTQDTEVNDRLYLAGQSHEFDAATVKRLIDSGAAIDPDKAVEPKPAAPTHKAPKAHK